MRRPTDRVPPIIGALLSAIVANDLYLNRKRIPCDNFSIQLNQGAFSARSSQIYRQNGWFLRRGLAKGVTVSHVIGLHHIWITMFHQTE